MRSSPALVLLALAGCGGGAHDIPTACALALGCSPSPTTTVSACLAASAILDGNGLGVGRAIVVGTVTASLACLESARDCAAAGDCLAVHASACSTGLDSACDGDKLVICAGPDVQLAIDCRVQPGATCSTDPHARQLAGHCVGPPCPPGPIAACDGSFARNCIAGRALLEDCAAEGQSCAIAYDGTAVCTDGKPCNPSGMVSCEGDDRIVCAGGVESRVHCGAGLVAGTCTVPPIDAVGACMLAPRGTCNPQTFVDHCDHDSLVYCDGHPKSLDCRSLGFAGCRQLTPVLSLCR